MGGLETLDPEAIFGGVFLIGFLTLLFKGFVRFPREVDREILGKQREIEAKDEIIAIHLDTIEHQRKTIEAFTAQDKLTVHLLEEIRNHTISRDHTHRGEDA